MGINGTDRPAAVVLYGPPWPDAQKGVPAFIFYARKYTEYANDENIPEDCSKLCIAIYQGRTCVAT